LIAAQEGWLPKKAAYINGRGTPWVLLTIFFIIGAIPILTGVSIRTIAMLGNGVSLIYVMFPIFTGYLIHKKKPEAMANAKFKLSRNVLFVFTTAALLGYALAAALNFGDISNSWIMMAVYSAAVIVYAFIRERRIIKEERFKFTIKDDT
jgi:APA family basic amino acid/polyamine antiporter